MDYFGMGRLGGVSLKCIERRLARADKELQIVADYCSAEVIPHAWGIVDNGRLPWLVAEVDRVIPANNTSVSPGDIDMVYRGVSKYNKLRAWRRLGLADIDPFQFVTGNNLNAQSEEPKLFLVDIEQLFQQPQTLV